MGLFSTHSWRSVMVLAVAAACSPSAVAQVSGRITGTVISPDGASVPGATVTLTNERTGETAVASSTEQGFFVFPNVNPSSFKVRVQAQGFSAYEKSNLILNANASLALGSIQLSVGSLTETVTVVSSGTAIDLDTSGQSHLVTSGQMKGLMSVGRDVVALMKVLPGVSQQQFSSNFAIGGSISGSETNNFSGTRAKWNSFKLDGQPGHNVDQINRFSIPVAWDAVEEVTVQPNSYLAEHGRSTGAHVNVISKSGTNEFHGSLYWFKRHEQFNANNFFNNFNGLSKPLGRFDSFGGTIGGPIKKDKLFFFVSQENWRIKLPGPLTPSTLPSELERRGDYSQTVEQNGRLVVIRDPNTNAPFPGNIIPTNRINRFGQGMLNVMPLPNSPSTFASQGFNYVFQQKVRIPKNQTQVKTDYLPSSKDRISARLRWFEHDNQGQTGVCCSAAANFPVQDHHYNFGNVAYSGTWTRTFSPNLVNEFGGGFYQSFELGTLTDQFDLSKYKKETYNLQGLPVLFPNANPENLIPAMQYGGVPNSPSLGWDNRTPIDAADERVNFQDTLSWVKSSHNVKFGFFYELQLASEGPRSSPNSEHMGRYIFNRDANNPFDSNHPFSNALLGNYQTYRESNMKSLGRARMWLAEGFAQDSWRATRRLTIDYGIRFTMFTPYRLREALGGAGLDIDAYNRAKAPLLYAPFIDPATNRRVARNPATGELAPSPLIGAFAPNTGDRLNGMIIGGYPEFKQGFRANPPPQISPRFGFALDAFGTGKTLIRGGFGSYKQAIFASGETEMASAVTTAPPIVESPSLFFSTIDGLQSARGTFFPTNEVFSMYRTFDHVPTVYKWSFGIQQNLGFGTVLDVAYVGNTARHLRQSRQLNTLAPGTRFLPSSNDTTTNRPLPDNFLRPIYGYQNVNLRGEEVGWSNYNSMQVSVNRRYSSGLQLGVAYTWSKSMGIADDDGGQLPMFTNYRAYLYGKTGYDQTHVLVLNYLYSIPNLSAFGKNAVTRGIFHNWQVAGITTFASGFPTSVGFSYTDGVDRHGGGDAPRLWMRDNPVLPRSERTFNRYFNTAAFAAPGRLEFGDAPRDVFRLPGINNFDFSVYKNIPITERWRAQFRWEMYNIFNHTQFDGVDTSARYDTLGRQINARFGQITSARNAREMQLSLRVEF